MPATGETSYILLRGLDLSHLTIFVSVVCETRSQWRWTFAGFAVEILPGIWSSGPSFTGFHPYSMTEQEYLPKFPLVVLLPPPHTYGGIEDHLQFFFSDSGRHGPVSVFRVVLAQFLRMVLLCSFRYIRFGSMRDVLRPLSLSMQCIFGGCTAYPPPASLENDIKSLSVLMWSLCKG